MKRLVPVVALLAGCGAAVHAGPAARYEERPIGEDLPALLPSGADAIVDVDMAQLDSWPTARRLVALMPAEGRAHLGRLGDDPIAQIGALVVGVYQAGTPDSDSIVLARGALDWTRLAAAGDAGDYHGASVSDAAAGSVARITPTVFAFGSKTGVRRVCDVAHKDDDGFRVAAVDERLRQALRHAPTAKLGRPAIMAALVPTEPLRERLRQEKWQSAADLDWLALSFAVGNGFDVGIIAGARGDAEAATLAKTMRARADELKTQATVRLLGLTPFVEPFIVVGRGSEVHVAYRLAERRVDQLVTRLEQMQGIGGKKAAAMP